MELSSQQIRRMKMKLSVYDKDCLPTWDEMYNEFWKHQIFVYDAKRDSLDKTIDPYWNRPKRKMILAWACNQLNKMVFEDGVDVVKFINGHYEDMMVCDDVRFWLLYWGKSLRRTTVVIEPRLIKEKLPPPIYVCKIPSTGQYGIFKTQHPSIDVDDLGGWVSLHITILRDGFTQDQRLISNLFTDIIRFVINDIIEYFENGIGWKDKDGKLIPTEQVTHCQGAGYDPAL
jgi:hypothetical protein